MRQLNVFKILWRLPVFSAILAAQQRLASVAHLSEVTHSRRPPPVTMRPHSTGMFMSCRAALILFAITVGVVSSSRAHEPASGQSEVHVQFDEHWSVCLHMRQVLFIRHHAIGIGISSCNRIYVRIIKYSIHIPIL